MECMILVVGMLKLLAKIRKDGQSLPKDIGMDLMHMNNMKSKSFM